MIMYLRRALSWLWNKLTNKVQDIVLGILAAGPIPKHVAFVMDGNRRYARRNNKNVQQGHSEGFVALKRVLDICFRLRVKCVTVYAFSIENFKRPKDEVDALMILLEEKLVEICQQGDLLKKHGVRLNILGKKELLPERVQTAIQKAENMTCENYCSILNVCMPYTSRDEITTAVEACVRMAVKTGRDGNPTKNPITEDDIDAQLMTSRGGSPPLDILIRTSGVNRLSDFLLWQCCENTQLHFSPTYWPEFGLLDFVPVILDYQKKVWHSKRMPP